MRFLRWLLGFLTILLLLISLSSLFISQISFIKKTSRIPSSNDQPIFITIQLKKPADTFRVDISPLKYNKSFAFSFTLDDGLVSDYLVAYPFFNGGRVSDHYIYHWKRDQGGDGLNYPGLFYTDGCGNKIPFRAGIAINAKDISVLSSIFHHGNLTWKQVNALYEEGWDVLNHSYTHATGKYIHAKYEVEENNKLAKENLGIVMRDFVIPGGPGDSVSNELYAKAAFESGMETVQCEDYGDYRIRIDSNLNLNHLKLGRLFMRSQVDTINGSTHAGIQLRSGNSPDFEKSSLPDETILFKQIDSLTHLSKTFWINAFTHSVGNQNLWDISLAFPQFRYFFNQLELRYGQQGADNIWMAPTQEVYEYLLNKKSVKYRVSENGNTMTIAIAKGSFSDKTRYHELTFLLNDVANNIQSVKCRGCRIESYSGKKSQSLINVSWN